MDKTDVVIERINNGEYAVYFKDFYAGDILKDTKSGMWSIDITLDKFNIDFHDEASTYKLITDSFWRYFYDNFCDL